MTIPIEAPSRRSKLFYSAVDEIERRGGETRINGKFSTTYLELTDDTDDLALLTAAGWRQYSRAFGARWVSLAYLYGVDDNGSWAVRVPGSIDTIAAALAWITPAEVKKAIAKGKRVKRQGDIYLVETTPAHDGTWSSKATTELFETHRWDPSTRTLHHNPADGRQHQPVQADYPVRLIPQRVYEMGRSGARTNGD